MGFFHSQDPETEEAKSHWTISHFVIYTCAFPPVTEKGFIMLEINMIVPFFQWLIYNKLCMMIWKHKMKNLKH